MVSAHGRECVVVKEEGLAGEEGTIQLHEESLQRTGVHHRGVAGAGVGEVRVHQQRLPYRWGRELRHIQ